MAAQSDLDDAAPASSVGEGGGGGGGGDESSGRRLIVDTVRGLLACASRDEPSTNSLPVAHRIHCTAAHQQMALGALTILLGAAISYAAYKLIGPMIKKSDDEDDIPGTSPSTSSNINDSNNNSSGGINAARHVSSYTKGPR